MSGCYNKIKLNKFLVEQELAMSKTYDEYYALKVSDVNFHVYGIDKAVKLTTHFPRHKAIAMSECKD